MPTYYLHQHRGHETIHDDEGGVYATLDGAIGDAAQAAREIMADRLMRGEGPDQSEFHIRDVQGALAATVRFLDVAGGKPFPPAPPRVI